MGTFWICLGTFYIIYIIASIYSYQTALEVSPDLNLD